MNFSLTAFVLVPFVNADLSPEAMPIVFAGPDLDPDGFLAPDTRTMFEVAVDESASIPRDFAEFLRTFVPSGLSKGLTSQDSQQLVNLLERTNFELVRGVDDMKKARVLNQIRIGILGSVRLHSEQLKAMCNGWDEERRVCRYISALATYYLWVHMCGALQYAPLINWVCNVWPTHLFEDIYTYERQAALPDDISTFFLN